VFNSWSPLADHDLESEVTAALGRRFPDDPPTFLARVPHGYCDADVIARDLDRAGFGQIAIEAIAVDSGPASADDLASGYCLGTPLRAEIEARGELEATTRFLAAELTQRFGAGEITGSMAALVVVAT